MKVFLIAAITIDGFIGRDIRDRSFDWTTIEDKQFYISKLKEADVIIMGSTTFKTFLRYPKNSNWVIYTSQPDKMKNPKPDVITLTTTKDKPKILLQKLEKQGHKKAAICGGASIYSLFMKSGLVDHIYLTVEPHLFGQGVKLFSDKLNTKLELISSKKLNDSGTMLLKYKVK